MRLITYQQESKTAIAALLDEVRALDLGLANQSLNIAPQATFADMLALIEAGKEGLQAAQACIDHAPEQAVFNISDVRLLAPIPEPPQLRDFTAFEKHYQQSLASAVRLQALAQGQDPDAFLEAAKTEGKTKIPDVWYQQPVYYKGNRFSVTGTDEVVQWPKFSNLMDYEFELACIIGKKGKDISEQDASDYIFGYTILNDLSARDAQSVEMGGMLGPAKSKDFDKANPMGPVLVTADELNPYQLEMVARVNGKEVSRGSSSSIHWSFEKMIAWVSQSETLYPGEVLGSGTVGDGCGLERMAFLNDGDVVELEIAEIGVLKTTIKAS